MTFGDGGSSSYTQVDSSGHLSLHGTATVWEDLRVPAQNTKINPSKSEPNFENWIGGLYTYHFDNNNADDESIHFAAQMPHSYKEGSDVYPHLHWSPNTTATGDIVWELEYSVANIGSTFPDTVTDTITASATGIDYFHNLDNFTTISDTSLTISHIYVCRLTRLGTDTGDTYTGDAVFLEFDFHFEIDTIGSKTESAK